MRKNKKGAVALETVLTLAMVLPILFSFIFGGYNFYLKQADNVNLNFEAGRYFSTLKTCDEPSLLSISSTSKFNEYKLITVIDGTRKVSFNASPSKGTIAVYCQSADWKKGYTFFVWTAQKATSRFIPAFYPEEAGKGGYYVVE